MADLGATPIITESGAQGDAKLTGSQSPNPPMTMDEEQFTSPTGVHTSIHGDGSILGSQVGQLKDTLPMPTSSRPAGNHNLLDKTIQFSGDGTTPSKVNEASMESPSSNSNTIGVEASDSI